MAWSECRECGFIWDWGQGSKYGPRQCPRCERRAKIAGVRQAISYVGDFNAPRFPDLTREALGALLALIVDGDELA